jgi:hypothetical protein
MRRIPLRLERLEDRSVPAAVGTPWPNSNITLSFAPDGTDINGSPSNLSALLSQLGTAVAQNEILRAFQTWAASTNINIGVVSDNGAAWDTPGLVQGDTRFGDIRIGGRAWTPDVLALTTMFNYLNTQSGNVALNTAQPINIGCSGGAFDLFTILLNESGNALGLRDNTDTTSAMYAGYQSPHTGLNSSDVATVQALYGARQADVYEGALGNDTLATATAYTTTLTADLTSVSDVDCYSFYNGGNDATKVINLRAAGLSLLQATVELVDSKGNVVASASAQDSLANNITFTTPKLGVGTYYVRVSGKTNDVFSVGSYRLTIGTPPATPPTTLTQITGNHAAFSSAAVLTPQAPTVGRPLDSVVQVDPDKKNLYDYFRVHCPTGTAGQPIFMVVSAQDSAALADATIRVFDANQNELSAQILTNKTGTAVIQVANIQASANYYVRVDTAVNFYLTVDFTTLGVTTPHGASGTFATAAVQAGQLEVEQTQIMQFVLTGSGLASQSIVMTIYDGNNVPVFVLTTSGGKTRSANVLLKRGVYRVEMSLGNTLGYLAGSFSYSLNAFRLTDPIGAAPVDPASNPDGGTDPNSPPPSTDPTTIWTDLTPADGSVWY